MCYLRFLLALLFVISNIAWGKEPTWQHYQNLLDNYTQLGAINQIPSRLVDYQALRGSKALKNAINELESFDAKQLHTKAEVLSFYINAYNLYAIKMVAEHYPTDSIRDIGSFFSPVWKKPVGKIGNQEVSLHDIEHNILRKLDEPRIHFAIVCASLSCPTLSSKAYRSDNLYHQLDNQTNQFLQDQRKGVAIRSGKLYLSKIFDWFEEDFARDGGPKRFIRKYRKLPDLDIKYLEYDWTLNDL